MRTIQVDLSAAELAAFFCDMTDKSQAAFFSEVARIASSWGDDPGYQWREVADRINEHPFAEQIKPTLRTLVAGLK
ncbi:MAG TPA: hypothetical protein VGN07_01480 [Steroidobacteraceae bacterium]|jgi:hypothetical protein